MNDKIADVFLIRHGQSTFNALFDETGIDPLHFDAGLSAAGRSQVENAKKRVERLPKPDLVVCSPLTRAIETAIGLFSHTDVPIVISCLHTERLANSCDVGRRPPELASSFPMLSFDHLPDPWWHHGPLDQRNVPIEPDAIFTERVARFQTWILGQVGATICVVGHGTFFHRLTGRHFANCEIARWDIPLGHDLLES